MYSRISGFKPPKRSRIHKHTNCESGSFEIFFCLKMMRWDPDPQSRSTPWKRRWTSLGSVISALVTVAEPKTLGLSSWPSYTKTSELIFRLRSLADFPRSLLITALTNAIEGRMMREGTDRKIKTDKELNCEWKREKRKREKKAPIKVDIGQREGNTATSIRTSRGRWKNWKEMGNKQDEYVVLHIDTEKIYNDYATYLRSVPYMSVYTALNSALFACTNL